MIRAMPRPSGCLLSLTVACAVVACNQGGTAVPVPPQSRTFDLGEGNVATLGSDGSFSIANGGTTIVASSPGTSLFARTSDPDDPDGWHDPRTPDSSLTVLPVDSTTVTAEPVDDGTTTKAIHLVVPAQPDDTALLSLTLATDDGFYTGLGEQFAHVSASGRVTPVFLTLGGSLESGDNEAHVPVPFLVSSRGWGVFVSTRQAGAFDVASTNPQVVTATFEGRTLDAWFFVDPDPLAVVARYDRLAGLPRPLPRWALSPIHWRHWASAEDVLSIATEYRTRHIPSSALWFDDGWQTSMDDFNFSTAMFGDVPSMMEQIRGPRLPRDGVELAVPREARRRSRRHRPAALRAGRAGRRSGPGRQRERLRLARGADQGLDGERRRRPRLHERRRTGPLGERRRDGHAREHPRLQVRLR